MVHLTSSKLTMSPHSSKPSLQTILISRFLLNLRRTQARNAPPSRPSGIRSSLFCTTTIVGVIEDMGQPLDHRSLPDCDAAPMDTDGAADNVAQEHASGVARGNPKHVDKEGRSAIRVVGCDKVRALRATMQFPAVNVSSTDLRKSLYRFQLASTERRLHDMRNRAVRLVPWPLAFGMEENLFFTGCVYDLHTVSLADHIGTIVSP